MRNEQVRTEQERLKIEQIYSSLKRLSEQNAQFNELDLELNTLTHQDFYRFGLDPEILGHEVAVQEVGKIIGSDYSVIFREGGIQEPYITIGYSQNESSRIFSSFSAAPNDLPFPAVYFNRQNSPVKTQIGVFPPAFSLGGNRVCWVNQTFFISSSFEAITYEYFIKGIDSFGKFVSTLPIVNQPFNEGASYYPMTMDNLLEVDHELSRIKSGEYIFPR